MCAEKEALRSDIYFSSHGLRFSQSLYHAEKDTVKLALQFNCVCLHFILLPVVKFCFSFFQTGELQPRLRMPATEHIRPLRITRPFHRLSVERLNRLPAGWLNRRFSKCFPSGASSAFTVTFSPLTAALTGFPGTWRIIITVRRDIKNLHDIPVVRSIFCVCRHRELAAYQWYSRQQCYHSFFHMLYIPPVVSLTAVNFCI